MSIPQLNPYINLDGTAADAIAFYQEVLGSVPQNVARLGDIPGMQVSDAQKGRVVHAVLKIGPGVVLADAQQGGRRPAATRTCH